jgi:uncharacterized protein (TIGR03382 family)
MRRVLLLAILLLAPVLGRAQTGVPPAGTIYFVNTDADPKASTINAVECSSSTATVQLAWTPTGAGAITYQLYAGNKLDAGATTSSTTDCPTEQSSNTSTNTTVVAVGTQLTNPSLANTTFSTSAMVKALVTSTLPDPCAGSTGTIYLCMQAKNSSGVNVGVARGQISLALTRPDATPTLNAPVQPGSKALTPSWGTNGSTNTKYYRVEAISLADPSVLPTAAAFGANGTWSGFNPADPNPHYSSYVTGTDARVGGLLNDVVYAVAVVGYTDDYNPSDPSNVASSMPTVVNDFWDVYRGDGGRETGGCSSGVAGPFGLLVLAGALALVRRRK